MGGRGRRGLRWAGFGSRCGRLCKTQIPTMKRDAWGVRECSSRDGRVDARDSGAGAPEWVERLTRVISNERENQRLGTQASCIEMCPKMGGGIWETRRDQESRNNPPGLKIHA